MILTRSTPTETAARCLINQAKVLEHVGRAGEAIESAQHALALAAGTENRRLIADSLLCVVSMSIATPGKRGIRQYVQRCLAYCRGIGYEEGIASCHTFLGILSDNDGQYRQGIEYYQKSAEYRRAIGDLEGHSIVLSNIGLSYYSIGEYQEAERLYRESLSLAEKAGATWQQAYVMDNIAAVLLVRGEYQTALQVFEKGLAMNQRLGYRLGQASNFHQIGFIHYLLGNSDLALRFLHEAECMKRLNNERWSLGCTLNLIARIHLDSGTPDRAGPYVSEGESIAADIGNPDLISRLAVTRGELAFAENDLIGAKSAKNRAMAVADQASIKRNKAEALLLWAKINTAQGEQGEAVVHFNNALTLFREMEDLLWQSVVRFYHGSYLAKLGRTLEARALIEDARNTLLRIGTVVWLKRAEQALAELLT